MIVVWTIKRASTTRQNPPICNPPISIVVTYDSIRKFLHFLRFEFSYQFGCVYSCRLCDFTFLDVPVISCNAKLPHILTDLFKASALWADAFYKSKCPSVRLSVCPSVRLSVCPSVCLFTFEVPFNGLFAPTSQSRMSNIFRDSESLGKSNGKKWSQI